MPNQGWDRQQDTLEKVFRHASPTSRPGMERRGAGPELARFRATCLTRRFPSAQEPERPIVSRPLQLVAPHRAWTCAPHRYHRRVVVQQVFSLSDHLVPLRLVKLDLELAQQLVELGFE